MAEVHLLIGTRKGLWQARSSGDRSSWTVGEPDLLMEEVAAVGVDPRPETGGSGNPRLFAGSQNFVFGTRVLHSDDLGATWDSPPKDSIRFPERTETALGRIWQITPGIVDGEVWAGVETSALFRSVDGGVTFTMNDALWDHPHRKDWQPGFGGQAVHTVLPHPTDSADITVAMSTGGVYRTRDSGASWNPANRGITAPFMPDALPEYGQCVHKVARNPADPEDMYAQNHGGVFRSTDGGTSWSTIHDGLPANFGFSVLADPNAPGTIYVFPLTADGKRFAPDGRLAVWRSADSGAHWEELRDGLPDEPVWSAVMRDAACTDTAERIGIYFGTRSGSVFAGVDGSFTAIAHDLPDVLSVRAAVIG